MQAFLSQFSAGGCAHVNHCIKINKQTILALFLEQVERLTFLQHLIKLKTINSYTHQSRSQATSPLQIC